ncbi:MAG: copper resistance protein CopZ [Roseburia sp.]|nr:copper resistance protein CopZ [Roseburia sp.]
MVKITLGIEGMACGMCETHINEAVRTAFSVKKVTSSHTKKQTIILAEQDIPAQDLKDAIARTGYEVVSVSSEPYEKKGFLSAFR